MATFTFRGLMAPVFTAFNKDWSVDVSEVPKYAKFLYDNGISAVLALGSTGEGPLLSVAERKAVTEAWVAAGKSTKQHVMVQVGGCALPDVLELAKHAEQIGADSLLCLPDLYFKPKTPQDLIDYLKNVAAAAPNTPLLYYHIPMWSAVDINMEQFLNLSVGQIPTFHGIKYTSNDLTEAYNALKAAGGRYAVFLGADTLVQPALALGFDSIIATSLNFMPRHHVKIAQFLKNNQVEEARKLQDEITATCKVIAKYGHWVPTMKVAMNYLTHLNVGLARAPLKNLNEADAKEMQSLVKQHYTAQ
ncbi:N-acetylneuraminate lyase-like [Anthonomus grandis grandis]|uniref:N-acetylneuraminate lyase-like n=1 Tax=Anthonomus grandis grandis TaxID=2921223 RepID=UPI002165B736|nr:N-acetylneuraminate lyase-like [Anthonomus grandis grandis]